MINTDISEVAFSIVHFIVLFSCVDKCDMWSLWHREMVQFFILISWGIEMVGTEKQPLLFRKVARKFSKSRCDGRISFYSAYVNALFIWHASSLNTNFLFGLINKQLISFLALSSSTHRWRPSSAMYEVASHRVLWAQWVQSSFYPMFLSCFPLVLEGLLSLPLHISAITAV